MKGRGAVTGNVAHMASPRTGAGAYAGVRDEVAFKLALERGGGPGAWRACWSCERRHHLSPRAMGEPRDLKGNLASS